MADRITRRAVFGAAGVAAAAVLAACNDDGPYAGPGYYPIRANGIVVDVDTIDNAFRPDEIEITVGTEVRWTNLGKVAHDISPVEGKDWGIGPFDFTPGATYSHVFTSAGEVPYYCNIHGQPGFGMTGTIVVVDE